MADTHKVKVLLTAEAGRLRRELQSAARGTRRLGDAFTGAAGRGDAMADRARAAGKRVEGAQAEAVAKVGKLRDAFTGAGRRSTDMAGQAEAAGERIEGAQVEAVAKVGRLRDAFTGAGRRSTDLAGQAEAAGERIEGAQVEAVAKVGRLRDAFTGAGRRSTDLAGQAEAAGERIEGAQVEAVAKVKRLGDAFRTTGQRATGMSDRAVAARRRIVGAVGSLGAAFGLAGGAFAIGASAKRIASIETRMERLGIQSQRSTEEMNALRGEIYEVANAPDIRVDPSELTAAVEAIVEKTGDLDFARANLRLIAEAIQGSGGTGDALGRMAAEFRKLGVTSEEEVSRMLNLLVVQGKSGAFTLGNMATEGERLFSAFAGLGYQGPRAVRELGAYVQMARQATGSSAQATTATERLVAALSDATKIEKLEELGVDLFAADGSRRHLSDVLTELIDAVDGDTVELSKIFDAEAMRGINALVREGGLEEYRRFLDIEARGDELATDAARIAATTEAQAQDIRTSFEAKLTEHFTGPLRTVATGLAEFQGEILAAAGAGFLLAGAFKAAKGGASLIQALSARGAGEGAGETLESAFEHGADADPGERGEQRGRRGKGRGGEQVRSMRVTTMHVGRMVGGGGPGRGSTIAGGFGADGGEGRGKSRTPLRDSFRRGGASGGIAGAVMGGVSIATAFASGNTENLVEDVAGVVGSVVGGVVGGAAGTFVAPGVGTVVGGVGGAMAGDAAARKLVDAFMSQGDEEATTHGVPDDSLPPWKPTFRETREAARRLDVAPAMPGWLRERRAQRGGGNVRIGTINVHSNASDPKQVAMEVADEIERRQRDERVRLEDWVVADGPAEIIY